MNTNKIIEQLTREYPNKRIVLNDQNHPTEVICDVETAHTHSDYSAQVCVINETVPHYHKKTNHVYYVLKGTLTLYIGDEKQLVKEDEIAVVEANRVHYAKGNETWVELYSEPGVTEQDTFIPEEASETPAEHSLLIQLNARDIRKTKEFYELLGFMSVWEKEIKGKTFLVMKKDGTIVCFSNKNDKMQGVHITLMTNNLEEFYKEVEKKVHVAEKYGVNELGIESFATRDPNGYTVTFTKPFNVLNPR